MSVFLWLMTGGWLAGVEQPPRVPGCWWGPGPDSRARFAALPVKGSPGAGRASFRGVLFLILFLYLTVILQSSKYPSIFIYLTDGTDASSRGKKDATKNPLELF